MPNRVYDDEDQVAPHVGGTSDDDLRRLTGIDEDQEGAMDRQATSGAASDILARERSAAKGNVGHQIGPGKPNSNITRGGLGVRDNSEAATKPDIQRGGFGKAAVKAKEQAAEGGGFFNATKDKATKKGGMGWKKKMAIGGAGGLIGVGGFFGLGSIIEGPLSVSNFGQLLSQFHMDEKTGQNNSRFLQQARYLRNYVKGTPERSRIGVVSRKFADVYRAKLSSQGISPINEGALGYQEGYRIDPEKFAEAKGLQDRSPAGVQKYLQESQGYATSIKNGVLETRQSKLFAGRALMNDTYRVAGFRGGDAVTLRFHAREAGLTLHPIRALDRAVFKTIDARFAEWKKRLREQVYSRTSTPDVIGTPEEKEGKPNGNSGDVNGQLGEVEQGAGDAGNGVRTGAPGALEKFSSSLQLKLLAGGAGLAAIACVFQALYQEADHINDLNIRNPMQQIASFYIAAGNQAGYGDDNANGSPVDEEQVGHIADTLYNATDQTEATSARSIQAELGNNLSGPDLPRDLKTKPSDSYIAQFVNGIPGIDAVCSAINSPAGTVVLYGLGAIISPVGTLLGALLQASGAPQALFEELAKQLAGVSAPSNPQGALLGNVANYGAFFLADGVAQSEAGVPLTSQEATTVAQAEADFQKQDFQNQNFATRMFDIHDNRSFIAQVMSNTTGPTPEATMSKFASGFLNIGQNTIRSFGSIFSSKINAAPLNSRYSYGAADVAHPVSDIVNPLVADPFANADAVAGKYDQNGVLSPGILDLPEGKDYIERAKTCFGVVIAQVPDVEDPGQSVWGLKPPSENDEIPPLEVMDKPENKCRENNDQWLRVRTFIWDTQIANSQACNQGDEQACIDTGLIPDPNSSAGTPNIGGTGVPTCATTAVSSAPAGYHLTNCEDFSGTKLENGWSGYDGGGGGTVSGAPRKSDHCVVANEIFTLKQDSSGTCGSSSSFDQKYGYWEVRMLAKETNPAGSSSGHPVLILWPQSDNGPSPDGEMDYFETDMGKNAEGWLHGVPDGGNCYHIPDGGGPAYDPAFYGQYHNWGLEWTPTGATGYVDGKPWWSSNSNCWQSPGAMHQTIQLDNFGSPPAKTSEMDVDWVHVYAK